LYIFLFISNPGFIFCKGGETPLMAIRDYDIKYKERGTGIYNGDGHEKK